MSKKNPTQKQQAFIKDVAGGKNPTQAVKDNYNPSSHESAKAMASNLLSLEHIKVRIEQELAKLEPSGVAWIEEAMKAGIGNKGEIDSDGRPTMSWEDKRKWLETAARLGNWGTREKPKSDKDVTPKVKRPD